MISTGYWDGKLWKLVIMSRNFVGVESSIHDSFIKFCCFFEHFYGCLQYCFWFDCFLLITLWEHSWHIYLMKIKNLLDFSSCLILDLSYLVRLSYQGSTVISLIWRYEASLFMPLYHIWHSVKNYNFLTEIDFGQWLKKGKYCYWSLLPI